VLGEQTNLLEASSIDQFVDALARGELAALVLLLDALFAAALLIFARFSRSSAVRSALMVALAGLSVLSPCWTSWVGLEIWVPCI
jgi:hypothetical protein